MQPLDDVYFPLVERGAPRDACGTGFVANMDGRATHEALREALFAVNNLAHRGAVDADRLTGDGAGVMFEIPQLFFRSEYRRITGEEPGARRVVVGVFFLPESGTRSYPRAKRLIEDELRRRGLTSWAWRDVPMRTEILGQKALGTLPDIEHLILMVDPWSDAHTIERRLFALRRTLEERAAVAGLPVYVASMSCRTIVYKGLMISPMLADFFPDLSDERFETSFAVFHQRYSTNTQPAWHLAQPFRCIAHNGEINTISGNRFWADVRRVWRDASVWRDQDSDGRPWPVLPRGGSDSACLDAALELLALSDRSLPHAMEMLIPSASATIDVLDEDLSAFYQYHACINEPWDGPAAVVFADGDFVGACLDRNGLRPARYKLTRDGMVVMSSEVGVLDMPDVRVVARGRLGPGQMLIVDLKRGQLHTDSAIKKTLAQARPWRAWLERHLVELEPAPAAPVIESSLELGQLQNVFGYSAEELKFVFEPMALEGKEPVGSMGDDTPLAVLSRQPRLPCTYFKQRFAQVTNPPIDSIREAMVMDLSVVLGERSDWLFEGPEHAKKIALDAPILTSGELARLEQLAGEEWAVVDALFTPSADGSGLKPAIDALIARAEAAVDHGARLLVISDRGADVERAPIPILLAVGAVNHALRRCGKRHLVSLIVDSGEPREVHHFATLIGYGASAIHAYLAERTILEQVSADGDSPTELVERWRAVLHKGLLKVIAKMGISVLRAYHGAQLFEIIGLDDGVVQACFEGTPSQVGGIGFDLLGVEASRRHRRGVSHERPGKLDDQGHFRFRRNGELHGWSPRMLRAVKTFRKTRDLADYESYRAAATERDPIALRDLLGFVERDSITLDEVESAEAICRRFTTAAMSLGSLAPETHRTLAMAMNKLGAKSNTGEGGEDPSYYEDASPLSGAIAKIKQIASGRFGVTTEYLMRAEEIEIKMAQGSKPGEGGQIPGHKVSGLIARLRRSVPGVALISPPPHHDIYSIEDLAQLIYDLRAVNPRARICVKLVAEAGVGTIAAGVAKAGADTILISGHDGGTGASPLSSIKNAGSPWELGLAETQQALVANNLRERVLLRTDGGLKTGRDVVIAAMLGAEEYNFGTAALVALGCRYVRQCHSNTCPVGIATQREDLRAKYDGDVDQLVDFFLAIGQEVRAVLASVGARTIQEVVGRSDLLSRITIEDHAKASALDLSKLTAPVAPGRAIAMNPAWSEERPFTLNERISRDFEVCVEHKSPMTRSYHVRNTDRALCATISGQIADRYGAAGLSEPVVRLELDGSAGQSFGAFLMSGVEARLRGEANDYVGKCMSGGTLVIRPDSWDNFSPGDIIAGNTILYGATGGQLFVAGAAGERFAVRNSGAVAVVEGVGAHGCEYMTNGVVVVLGATGLNFAAGMTGGRAYILDPTGAFEQSCHQDFVKVERMGKTEDATELVELLRAHVRHTQSPTASALLEQGRRGIQLFWKVTPRALEAAEARAGGDDQSAA